MELSRASSVLARDSDFTDEEPDSPLSTQRFWVLAVMFRPIRDIFQWPRRSVARQRHRDFRRAGWAIHRRGWRAGHPGAFRAGNPILRPPSRGCTRCQGPDLRWISQNRTDTLSSSGTPTPQSYQPPLWRCLLFGQAERFVSALL
jgi:hypothetical protein